MDHSAVLCVIAHSALVAVHVVALTVHCLGLEYRATTDLGSFWIPILLSSGTEFFAKVGRRRTSPPICEKTYRKHPVLPRLLCLRHTQPRSQVRHVDSICVRAVRPRGRGWMLTSPVWSIFMQPRLSTYSSHSGSDRVIGRGRFIIHGNIRTVASAYYEELNWANITLDNSARL